MSTEHRYVVLYSGEDDGDAYLTREWAERHIERIRKQENERSLAETYEPMTIRHMTREVSEWIEVTP